MYLDHPLPTPRASPQSYTSYTDPFSDDTLPTSSTTPTPPPAEANSESADSARLRRTHTTQGYRDGITQGKSAFLQDGFDEGYTLGGRFGLAIGRIMGVLEGLWHLARAAEEEGEEEGRVMRMRREAEGELAIERVFAKEWFVDGVWRYEVPGEEESLDRVVECHPVVAGWVARVKEEVERRGMEVMVVE